MNIKENLDDCAHDKNTEQEINILDEGEIILSHCKDIGVEEVINEDKELERKITKLFQLRTELWSCNEPLRIFEVSKKYGINLRKIFQKVCDDIKPDPDDLGYFTEEEILENFSSFGDVKKVILNHFVSKNFPESLTIKEHFEKLQNIESKLIEHLTHEESKSVFFLFGSYANGVIKSKYSDLDFLVILPHLKEENEINDEIQKLKSVKKLGFIFSNELCSIEDCRPIMQKGDGLARLYGITSNGVEIEFHLIGEKDAQLMTKITPNKIERIRPVQAKKEKRTSLTGKIANLPKNETDVKNYFIDENGEVYGGFFPDATLTSNMVYDNKQELGKKHYQNVWFGVVKAFLYNNKYAQKNNKGEYLIDVSDSLIFEKFLNTFFYKQKDYYSQEKYEFYQKMFFLTIGEISKKYQFNLEK